MTNYKQFLKDPAHRTANLCRVSYELNGEGKAEFLQFSDGKWYRPEYLEMRKECGCYGDLWFPGNITAKIVDIRIVTSFTNEVRLTVESEKRLEAQCVELMAAMQTIANGMTDNPFQLAEDTMDKVCKMRAGAQ